MFLMRTNDASVCFGRRLGPVAGRFMLRNYLSVPASFGLTGL